VRCRGILQSAIVNSTVNAGQGSVNAGIKPENRPSQTWSNLVKPKDFLSPLVGIFGKPDFFSNPQSTIDKLHRDIMSHICRAKTQMTASEGTAGTENLYDCFTLL